MHKEFGKLGALGLLTLLTACNGGGGGGGETTTDTGQQASGVSLEVTETNQKAVAQNAISAMNNANQVSHSGGSVASGVAISSEPVRFDWRTHVVDRLQALAEQQGSSGLAGVAATVSIPCTGSGSISGTFTDADSSQDVSKGDTITATFNNCVESVGAISTTFNGTVSLGFAAKSGRTDGQSPWSVTVSMNMPQPGLHAILTEGVTTVDTTSTGDMTLMMSGSLNSATINASSDSLSIKSGNESWTYSNFKMATSTSGTTLSLSADGGLVVKSAELSGSYQINMSSPATPFVFSSVTTRYPDSGEMRIQGSKSTLTITAQPNGMAQVSLTTASGKTVTSTKTWCELAGC